MKKALFLFIFSILSESLYSQCEENTTPPPTIPHTTNFRARAVSEGYDFSLVIMHDGTLWSWGNNEYGQLGNATKINSIAPVRISAETDWQYISAGTGNAMAIKNDGTLWAWGSNGAGQLGDGTNVEKLIPTQVGADTNWKYVSAGGGHYLGLKTDGSLWSWGSNAQGTLGDGTITNRNIPVRIGTDTDWKAISAGGLQSVAIKNNGSMWTWGKIGVGNYDGVRNPVELDFYGDWQSVSAGIQHILAIRSDGTLWAWGSNEYSQLGNNSPGNSDNEPKKISNDTDWKSISAGMNHSAAIKQNGELWLWGQSGYGQLGNGLPPVEAIVPTRIVTDAGFEQVSVAGFTTLSVKHDGTVWVWGRNYFGELGDGTTTTRYVPTALAASQQNFCAGTLLSALNLTGTNIKWYDVPSGGVALPLSTVLQAGNFYYASQTISGQESCLRTSIRVTTDPVVAPTGLSTQLRCGGSTLLDLSVTGNHIKWYDQVTGGLPLDPSTMLVDNKQYFASQTNDHCESVTRLAVEVSINTSLPSAPVGATTQLVCPNSTVSDLVATGSQIKWFENPTDGLPLEQTNVLVNAKHYYATQTINECESASRLDVTVSVNSIGEPLPLTSMSNKWESLSLLSSSALGLKSDGTLWGWGHNFLGQLGNGTSYNSINAPVQSGAASWNVVASGDWHSAGVRSDGTLWAWGDNHALQPGLLGDGNNVSKSEPNQIGTETNWKSVSVSFSFTLALKKDGTLWAWGDNEYGQLGDGTNTDKTIPVQIGTSSDWVSVTAGWLHAFAIKSDGTLWAWGYNGHGQLGDGTTTAKKFPTKIGTSTDWKFIATSSTHNFGIKTDGSLWAWGQNNAGEFGNGTFVSSLIPKRIGTATDWKTIATTIQDTHTLAVKTDGTLWGWGTGHDGELGNGQNSPIPTIVLGQIGTANDWVAVEAGRFYSVAIKTDGTLWAWGTGPLGLGASQNSFNTPQLVASPSTIAYQEVCSGATIADLSLTGTNVQWYSSVTDETALPSSVLLIKDSYYYASQTISGCESSSRLAVLIKMKDIPAPSGSSTQAFCEGATVASLSSTGSDVKWYAQPIGGSQLVANVLLENTKYFASQTLEGCESPLRLVVQAEIKVTPAPIGNSTQNFCEGSTLADVAIEGSDIKWYTSSTDGTQLPGTTTLGNTQYFASQTLGGCESSLRLSVTADIHITPAPTGLSPQIFEIGQTVADLIVSGTGIKWYSSTENAITRTDPLSTSLPLISNTSYFATQTILGCESLETLSVIASIVTGIESIELLSDFYPNPVNDFLNIKVVNAIETVSVTNSIGQPLLSRSANSNHIQLDFRELPSGVYIIHLQFKDRTMSRKVIRR